MSNKLLFWIIFSIVVVILFFIDLWVTSHRKGKIGLKRSLIWSGIWIGAALVFNVFLYFYFDNGHQKALEFLTGYLIEKSLSVDNLFVFIMIFSIMGVPDESRPLVLKWGIIGAIVFRIIFILLGVQLIELFHPIIYFFGALLLYAAYKMAFGGDEKIDLHNNRGIKLVSKFFSIKSEYHGNHFFIREKGKIFATPLFITLVLIESSDIVFAIDSIPAIIAITQDTFIIITSNIFAILGLRALYFALAGIIDLFHYLKYGVAVVLFYVGVKMLISDIFPIPTAISLGVIVACLTASIILSLYKSKEISGK